MGDHRMDDKREIVLFCGCLSANASLPRPAPAAPAPPPQFPDGLTPAMPVP